LREIPDAPGDLAEGVLAGTTRLVGTSPAEIISSVESLLREPDAYQVWHSSQAANQGSNHIGYKNARVDQILESYRREFDPQRRIELYREFQRILSDEQPYTFLFVGKSVVAAQRRIRGIEVFPGGVRALDWWVPKAAQKYGQQATAN
jgi:ABC-type transport system substrate-binding protein